MTDWPSSLLEAVIADWNSGLSAEEISSRVQGKSRAAIISKLHRLWQSHDSRILRRVGDRKQLSDAWSDEQLLKLLALRERGESMEALAKRFRRAVQTVAIVLAEIDSEGAE